MGIKAVLLLNRFGTGALDWDREERISDRYGLVKLFGQPGSGKIPTRLRRLKEGYGQLVAVVREARNSLHIGDLFRCILPSKPVSVSGDKP